MLIPSGTGNFMPSVSSLSRRVNANSQLHSAHEVVCDKLIKKGEC